VDVPEIDVETLERHLAAGAPLIDVRQPDEYTELHVPGSVLIPLGAVPERVDEVPRDVPVYVICRTGNRSRTASAFLIEQGIDATNVAGGTVAWLNAGKPAATGSEPG
jgi:rhodanese-related sulfurtransferase